MQYWGSEDMLSSRIASHPLIISILGLIPFILWLQIWLQDGFT